MKDTAESRQHRRRCLETDFVSPTVQNVRLRHLFSERHPASQIRRSSENGPTTNKNQKYEFRNTLLSCPEGVAGSWWARD